MFTNLELIARNLSVKVAYPWWQVITCIVACQAHKKKTLREFQPQGRFFNHRDGSCGLLLEGMKPERRKDRPGATHHPSKGRGILTAVITAGLTNAASHYTPE